MPGESHRGLLPPLTTEQRELAAELSRDVHELAGDIGERNSLRHDALTEAADWLESSFAASGRPVQRQGFDLRGRRHDNLEIEVRGSERPDEIVVAGAHYDSVIGSPGANDNGSGVSALLALARRFADRRPARTLRLVAFVNEEPPHFRTEGMGSLVYARRCRRRGENVVAMLSLETIGWYSDRAGSQRYPLPLSLFYPSTGDFLGFVGNLASRKLVRRTLGSFRKHARFPSEGAALPGFVPGIGWSDQWSFWTQRYRAVMLTDTALFRYPHYHTGQDTPDKVDCERLARVVEGIDAVLEDLLAEGV